MINYHSSVSGSSVSRSKRRRDLFVWTLCICWLLVSAGANFSVNSSIADAAAKAPDKKNSVSQQISRIRLACTAIDKQRKSLMKRNETVLGISLEGADVTYYSAAKILRKIEANLLGETYQDRVDLCYVNDKLVFAFERFARYESDLTSPLQPPTLYRYYFANDMLLQMTVDGRVVKPISPGEEDTEGYWRHKDEFVSTAADLKTSFTA